MLSLCEEGDADAMSDILNSGKVDANTVDADGYSALILAACYGHSEVKLCTRAPKLLKKRATPANAKTQTYKLIST